MTLEEAVADEDAKKRCAGPGWPEHPGNDAAQGCDDGSSASFSLASRREQAPNQMSSPHVLGRKSSDEAPDLGRGYRQSAEGDSARSETESTTHKSCRRSEDAKPAKFRLHA
uniref:Uncharacterized protein n=1 Tax=Haptolina brevifila TaxID=156173 RepID=A0A7S2NFZ0_9EUKA